MFWNSYRYKIENGEAVILEYVPGGSEFYDSGRAEEFFLSEDIKEGQCVSIPAEIDGYPVTEIGEGAFSEHGFGIERIEVPKTVRTIGDYAFKMCMSLTELTLHEGLTEIGKGVLDVTSMTKIHIPSTVRQIKNPYELGEFYWEIGADNPFYHTDGYALYYTQMSDAICNPSEREERCPAKMGEQCQSETGEQRAVKMGEWRPSEYGKAAAKSLVAVQKQDERTEYQVEEGTGRIGHSAFEGQAYLQKLTLPVGIEIVEEGAFESCQNLQEIFLPEGLKKIEADVFRHCVRLKELCLPSTLRFLGERALTDTFGWSDKLNGISRIVAARDNPVFETDENALYSREENGMVTLIKYFGKEREFVIPEKVFQIGESAFRRSNVKHLVIPESVSDIGRDAFRECKNLESVFIEADQVLLYVPRTPVYRKDEVAALFYTLMNVRPLRQEYALQRTQEYPVCHTPDGAGGREPSRYGNGRSGIYDYIKYDKLVTTWSQLPERCRMACFRLKYPLELDEETEAEYRNLISDKLAEILIDISDREDSEYLTELTELGFFTSDNIDDAIDIVSRCRKAKLTGYLMEYKQEHLGLTEFDFSL